MHRGLYEICFEIPPVDEATEDGVCKAFDAVIACHSGVTTVTLSAEGPTCVGAAQKAMVALRNLGATPLRLVDDLVDRREIARRAGVTPQAVGQWVRGERHAGEPFPAPFVLSGGGLWLWGEVLPALDRRGIVVDGDIDYPTRIDSQVINGLVATSRAPEATTWQDRLHADAARPTG